MKIKFLAFYDTNSNQDQDRISPMSSKNVIDDLTEKLNVLGFDIEIISMSTTRKINKFYPSKKIKIRPNLVLSIGPTLHSKVLILDKVATLLTRMWVMYRSIKKSEGGDIFIIWHAIPTMMPTKVIQNFLRHKKVKFIFYVGELYQKVLENNLSSKRIEQENSFLKTADAYILSTEFLKDSVRRNAPTIVLPGVLKGVQFNGVSFRDNDQKIHVVYSGIIDSSKGAFLGVELAKFLDENYIIHIIGWSKNPQILQELKTKIAISNDQNRCRIVFDGLLKGHEYDNYLSACDIGICSQDVDAAYTNFSFPSKILAYLSHNLRVVSVDIPTIKNSQFGKIINFVSTNDAGEFAEKIKSITLEKKYDSRELLKKMDLDFVESLKKLIES